MKIRITSAKGPEWYANKIGETFELTGETTTIDGVVRHCVDYNGDRRRYYVSEGNFEVVAEPDRSTVVHEGVTYRKVKRKAEAGDKILIVGAYASGGKYQNGSVLTVNFRDLGGLGVVIPEVSSDGNSNGYISDREYVVLEKVADDRLDEVLGGIATLTLKVASLEKRIAELEDMRKSSADTDMSLAPPPTLSREDVIERAREDVGLLITVNSYHQLDFEFIVNRKKRTVVCLRKFYGEVVSRGVAKCAPDDVFNVHIGKAISLRRALDYDIPAEYTQAPKPKRAQAGDVIRIPNGSLRHIVKHGHEVVGRKYACMEQSPYGLSGPVIDDSRTGNEREAYGI